MQPEAGLFLFEAGYLLLCLGLPSDLQRGQSVSSGGRSRRITQVPLGKSSHCSTQCQIFSHTPLLNPRR